MQNHFKLSNSEFEQRFIDCEIDPSIFSHEAHLRLAWININKYGLAQAEINIQKQLKAYVKSVGASDKYNATLTLAAIKAVSHFMQKSISNDFKEFMIEFPQLNNNFKGLISYHYSFDIYNSDKAKKEFLEPDLNSFD